MVLLLELTPQVVMSKGTTALAAIRTREGEVLLVTDRSTQYNEMLTESIPVPGPDQIKVETTRNRLHIAIAGIMTGGPNGDGSIDLLELARREARSTINPGEAANKIRQSFDTVADAIRSGAQVGAFETPIGHIAALTAVILAGVWNYNVEVHEVALTVSGLCTASTMNGDSVAIAPANSLDNFRDAVSVASQKDTIEEAATVMLDAIHHAANKSVGYVSHEADFVSVYPDGTSVFTHIAAPEQTFEWEGRPI